MKSSLVRINSITAVLMALAGIVIFSLPVAYAADTGDMIIGGMLDCINNGVMDTINEIFITDSDGYMALVTGHSGSLFPTIMNGCLVIGAFMCIIAGFMRAFKNMDQGMDGVESLTKMFQELCIVGCFMINLPAILEKFYELGVWLITLASGGGSVTADAITMAKLDDILNFGVYFGPIDWVKVFCLLAIPFVLSFLAMGVAYFTCFSLLVEIGILRAFCPMAVYDIYGEGLRSPGMMYLKRYFATYVKVAICLIVVQIGLKFMESCVSGLGSATDVWGILKFLVKVVAINFTTLGVMQRAGEFANYIVGN